MIDELFAVPEIMFTHIAWHKSHFQYWQRSALIARHADAFHLCVHVELTQPSVAWLAGINLQFISMKSELFLALSFIDQRWWLVQSFGASWTYSNEHDKQCFLTQFAIAAWVEQDARYQTRPVKSTGIEAYPCII
ncbi:hypothetical protein GE278_23435 (plasmid) [Enterobacteriaceae bacterium Kacie_13]|nr:hypothetical protein GE278_23435 [Enterobacteriaceae bacterium Kacie_13]